MGRGHLGKEAPGGREHLGKGRGAPGGREQLGEGSTQMKGALMEVSTWGKGALRQIKNSKNNTST